MSRAGLTASALAVALAVTGCVTATQAGPAATLSATPTATATVTPNATPTASATPTPDAARIASASASAAQLALLPDPRTGAQLDSPLVVKGVTVINRNHRVTAAFAPKTVGTAQLAPEAAQAYATMVAAAKKAGVSLVWRVGYRSYATQVQLLAKGDVLYGSDAKAANYIAQPGQSEHQAGLAVDVASKSGRGTKFPKTKEFAWMRAHSHEYGFVLRYPEGKSAITGYNYESWHYRYVGVEVARQFGPNSNLTLEEFLGGR